jgi:hypothetical protein
LTNKGQKRLKRSVRDNLLTYHKRRKYREGKKILFGYRKGDFASEKNDENKKGGDVSRQKEERGHQTFNVKIYKFCIWFRRSDPELFSSSDRDPVPLIKHANGS